MTYQDSNDATIDKRAANPILTNTTNKMEERMTDQITFGSDNTEAKSKDSSREISRL